MTARKVVHVVVPDAIDDPLRPSGGNRYDRKVCDGLADAGWRVHEHAIPAAWPRLTSTGSQALARVVSHIPDGSVVLVDGLIAAPSSSVLVPAARRLSLVVLLHAAPDDVVAGQSNVLKAAHDVIATSGWVRDQLLRVHPRRPETVHVAEPGADPSPLATGTPSGGELLCVASVAHHKGHDVLLAALAELAQHRWQCRCVGSLDYDRRFVARLRRQAHIAGANGRVQFTGPQTGPDLEAAYTSADVLVHPARVEPYGMVVTEALAHGLPVITTGAGGLPDALGATADGVRPGLLVPPGEAPPLAGAIAAWLTDHDLRRRLRRAACARRPALATWSTTTERIEHVLRALV